MDRRSVKRITDASDLKAIAHPLRVRLLGSLRIDGPATASELGRQFGESSGSTSYHLRVLQKHGFIEEDPEQPNARDRRWRAAHAYTSWNNDDFRDDPVGAEAAQFMRRRQLDNVIAATETFESQVDAWSREWNVVAGHSDYAAFLTAESLRQLRSEIGELVSRYAERDADASDTQKVRMYLAAFPTDSSEY